MQPLELKKELERISKADIMDVFTQEVHRLITENIGRIRTSDPLLEETWGVFIPRDSSYIFMGSRLYQSDLKFDNFTELYNQVAEQHGSFLTKDKHYRIGKWSSTCTKWWCSPECLFPSARSLCVALENVGYTVLVQYRYRKKTKGFIFDGIIVII